MDLNEDCTRAGDTHASAEFADSRGATLDVCADSKGISLAIYPGEVDNELDVPYAELPDLIGCLLAGPDGEGMKALSDRYEAMFTPPDLTLPAPRNEVLWLASAYLHRLAEHRDYETWDEDDIEGVDGMLREIINTAYAVRTRLLGEPDCPVPAHYRPDPAKLQQARDETVAGIESRLAEVRSRAMPVILSGCTCGGIGSTGSHRPPCPWSAR